MTNSLIETKYRPMAEQAAFLCGSLLGKTVLDVGCDKDGTLISLLVKDYGVKEAVGVNPSAAPTVTLPKQSTIVRGDITKALFPGEYFDVILSLAAFEHIHDMDSALAEMHRILKPGGLLFSKFGPIWPSCWGHHLWVVHEGNTYNYMNTILPPFCHLLSTPEETMTYCLDRYSEHLSKRIVDYIFTSPEQNRLFYEDYVRIISDSPFNIISFYDGRDSNLLKKYFQGDYVKLHRQLRAKFPCNSQFDCETIYLLLDKS